MLFGYELKEKIIFENRCAICQPVRAVYAEIWKTMYFYDFLGAGLFYKYVFMSLVNILKLVS